MADGVQVGGVGGCPVRFACFANSERNDGVALEHLHDLTEVHDVSLLSAHSGVNPRNGKARAHLTPQKCPGIHVRRAALLGSLPVIRPARKSFMYTRVGLHLLALLTIAALVGVSTERFSLAAEHAGATRVGSMTSAAWHEPRAGLRATPARLPARRRAPRTCDGVGPTSAGDPAACACDRSGNRV